MWDNYSEEIKPLFRLLRTEAFRFILVHFNHYSLAARLKEDLRERLSDRPFAEIDAEEVSYRQLANDYFHLSEGIFLINNFESVLDDPEKYNGLNLHRDLFAQYPVAMICFISPGAQVLSAKAIMEKMPDLWSFRSFMLDLRTDIAATGENRSESIANEVKISSLGGYTYDDKRLELQRLKTELAKISSDETPLLQTIYTQIKTIQEDIGLYSEALEIINTLKGYISDKEGLADLFFQEGDLLRTIGKSKEALSAFMASEGLYSEYPETNKRNTSVIYQRLGSIYSDIGDLPKALEYYKNYNKLSEELFSAYPNNVKFKNGLAISYRCLGDIESSLGNLDKALSYCEESLKLSNEIFLSYPDNVEFKGSLAISYQDLGNVQSSLGNPDKALSYYEKYNKLSEELFSSYPDNVDFKNGLAISYQFMGNVQSSLGNLDKALSYYEKYNKLSEELFSSYPDNVDFKNNLAISYQDLGNLEISLENYKKALEYYEKNRQLQEELHKDYPDNIKFKNDLTLSLAKLGLYYKTVFKNEITSKEYFLRAEQLWKELVASFPLYIEFEENLQKVQKLLNEL